jgi:hypothetical protein
VSNNENPFSIDINNLPRHNFIPSEGESIDPRALGKVVAGTVEELILEYRCPIGKQAFILGYSLFNDGLFEADTQFFPKKNGVRILANHGHPTYSGDLTNPTVNYKMSLALGPNMSNANLIPCYIFLKSGDRVTWQVSNGSAVDTFMGVRMSGFEVSNSFQIPKLGA